MKKNEWNKITLVRCLLYEKVRASEYGLKSTIKVKLSVITEEII